MPNKINQTFFLTLLVVVLLVLLSAFGKEINYKGFRLKKINILADVLPDSLQDKHPATSTTDAFVMDTSFVDTLYTETYLEDTAATPPKPDTLANNKLQPPNILNVNLNNEYL